MPIERPDVVTLTEQIVEVERERHLRGGVDGKGGVYAHWVKRGSLSQETADRQLRALNGVLATLKWLQRNEERIKARADEG